MLLEVENVSRCLIALHGTRRGHLPLFQGQICFLVRKILLHPHIEHVSLISINHTIYIHAGFMLVHNRQVRPFKTENVEHLVALFCS